MAVDPARAKSLFLAAADFANPADRAAWLDVQCGDDVELRARVDALLRANDATPDTDATVTQKSDFQPLTEDYADSTARVGSILAGKYKLIEELGEGGMGSVFVAQQTMPGRFTDAIAVFEAGSAATNPVLKPQLIEAYTLAGQHDKIIALLLKQLPEARKLSPEQVYTLTEMLTQLGAAYLAQKNGVQAESYLRECLTVLQKLAATGVPDWRLHYVESMLGAALLAQQKYTDAEPLLLKGYEGMNQQRKFMSMEAPKATGRIPEAIDRLIELYTATNKPEAVKKWQAERAKYAEVGTPK